jgi:hypothetical protein
MNNQKRHDYYGVVLIPGSGKDTGFGIASQLAGFTVTGESRFCTPFDFLERYDLYISDPTFLMEEKNILFFVRHFKDSIFKHDFISIVYNFEISELGLIIEGLREINPKITVLVIVKNQADVPEIKGVDFHKISDDDSSCSDIMAKLGA